MSIKKYKPEQIVVVLRQIEARISFLKTQRQRSANLQRQY